MSFPSHDQHAAKAHHGFNIHQWFIARNGPHSMITHTYIHTIFVDEFMIWFLSASKARFRRPYISDNNNNYTNIWTGSQLRSGAESVEAQSGTPEMGNQWTGVPGLGAWSKDMLRRPKQTGSARGSWLVPLLSKQREDGRKASSLWQKGWTLMLSTLPRDAN